ncbi:MAG: hypothetical protein QGG40_10970 [Myxococcota bacterium]|nr:hypothetical protein [Myxococcota bacterium]
MRSPHRSSTVPIRQRTLSFATLLMLSACGGLGLDATVGIEGSSSADTTEDLDLDTASWDTGIDGDLNEPGPSAPTIEEVELTQTADETVELALWIEDENQDLLGGTLELTIDGESQTLAFPDDLESWDPMGWSIVVITVDPCDGGDTLEVSATITDSAALTSDLAEVSLTLNGNGVRLEELGGSVNDATDLGELSLPLLICGDIYDASNNSGNYAGDLDWVSFEATSNTTLLFELTWVETEADYDLHLKSSSGQNLASANDVGFSQTESFSHSVGSGYRYNLMVAGRDGNPGLYTLRIE